MTTPAWYPDPQGRHELRWWDGSRWTDQVSDHGIGGVDPLLQPVAPVPPAVLQPTAPPPMAVPNVPPPTMVTPVPAVAARPNRTPWIVGGVVAVAALVAGGVVLLGGDDDDKGTTPAVTTTVVATTVPSSTTTVVATTTSTPATTLPPTTLPTVADADALLAALPGATDVPPDWTLWEDADPAPQPSDTGSFCDGPNTVRRAQESGSTAEVFGPSWDLPDHSWFGVDAYSFPSPAEAAAFLAATDTQANGCMTDPPLYTWDESDLDLLEEGFGDDAVWDIAEGDAAFTETTPDADALVRTIFEQYASTTVEGADYSATLTEFTRFEQHGRVVLVMWIYGAWNFQGFGSEPDWAFQPSDAAIDAAAAVVRPGILAELTVAGMR